MVANSTAHINKFLYGASDLGKTEFRNLMLLGDMNISRLMKHAQHVEGDNLREQDKENKKARTGNQDYSQVVEIVRRVSRSFRLQPLHQLVFHPPRTGKEGCFGCIQSGHRFRDYPSRQGQRGGNGRAQSTTLAAPASRPTQQGNLSGTGGG
nr:uncharacterized protein LOC101248654 [Solanum lycopersicum]